MTAEPTRREVMATGEEVGDVAGHEARAGADVAGVVTAGSEQARTVPASELAEPDVLRALGLDALLRAIAAEARSARGRARCEVARVYLDRADARESIERIEEARYLLRLHPAPALGLEDVRPVLLKLRRDGVLGPESFVFVRRFTEGLARLLDYFYDLPDRVTRLRALAAEIDPCKPYAAKLRRSFDDEGTLLDDATPELRAAREEERREHQKMQRRVQELVRKLSDLGLLREDYYTLRNDRYVLPVKSETRAEVAGIVHDASQTGQTVFVEPEVLVEHGNRLTLARARVREEERRILIELSRETLALSATLDDAAEKAAWLDEVFARARVAETLDANAAGDARALHLTKLRHPLLVLAGESVVPNDLVLGDDGAGDGVGDGAGSAARGAGLIITGPNAGGKSVLLKAAGLSALLHRMGMPIAASASAALPFVTRVMGSFGDAQDLDAHLSSFTGQLARLTRILEASRPGTLVLLDEIGTETDPREGAALAIAVIERIVDAGALVLTTTHYPELRSLALDDPRFTNASVGIHPETFRPTFRLETGLAGQSYAFEAARRGGLPEAILRRAEQIAGEREVRLGRLSAELETQRMTLSRMREEIEARDAELASREQKAHERNAKLEQREREVMHAQRKGLLKEIAELKAQVTTVVSRLRQLSVPAEVKSEGDLEAVRAAIGEAEKGVAELQSVERETAAKVAAQEREHHAAALVEGHAVEPSSLAAGRRVFIPAFRSEATVEVVDLRRERVTVLVFGKRVEVRLHELRGVAAGAGVAKIEAPKPAPRPEAFAAGAVTSGDAFHFELDLRGKRVGDALDELDGWLDAAARNGLRLARVIHGHGTGALKQAVRENLSRSPWVASFHSARQEEGGDGATEVELSLG